MGGWQGLLALSIAAASEWVDPDTPEAARSIVRSGVTYKLAFSDEFNVDGRTFGDGHDSVWTGLDTPSSGNEQVNGYNSSLAYTKEGKLILQARAEPWTWPADPTLTLHYQTPMLQTWNKMCFTGGFIELKAKMPGSSEQEGLWPAFWMMGNLGRATFKPSTDRMWPFNYDQCPSSADRRANQYYSVQELSKCTLGKGRGAPEIDIIETMPGMRPSRPVRARAARRVRSQVRSRRRRDRPPGAAPARPRGRRGQSSLVARERALASAASRVGAASSHVRGVPHARRPASEQARSRTTTAQRLRRARARPRTARSSAAR
jgi:hypothetical protein